MTLLLDPNVLVTNSFIPQVKALIPIRYHKVKDSNLEETIEKLEAVNKKPYHRSEKRYI